MFSENELKKKGQQHVSATRKARSEILTWALLTGNDLLEFITSDVNLNDISTFYDIKFYFY